MRIIKYLFLLLILASIAVAVFIATQKGDYQIVRSKIIKSPRSTVYNYVNEYRNWENWNAWNDDDQNIEITYPAKTSGIGGAYYWSGKNGNGNMKTIFTKTNDSIVQKMVFNDAVSDVYWSFKDTLGGTKVTWKAKGTLAFMLKINTFLNGGPEKIIGNAYEQSLVNLDKKLDYEINTYTIKPKGLVTKLGGYYLKKTINSKISNLSKNLKIMIPNMMAFFKKNNITMSGKPFVIYNSYDRPKGITNFSVCLPIKNQIFFRDESDISCGQLEPFLALKTVLTGDYSHNKKAWDKSTEYMIKNNHYRNSNIPLMEVYSVGLDEEKSPSKWVTNIYIPIRPKNTYYRPRVAETPENPKVEAIKPMTQNEIVEP
ncbi:MAG: GyrI-like domain-containing protein [Bacteroidota bacterium]